MDNKDKELELKKEALKSFSGNGPEVSKLDPINQWMDIDKSKISYEGKIYPENWRFQVKACDAGLLKYFSTLDENNPITIQDALLYVVKEHVRIFENNRVLKSLDSIYEHDKFLFTMLVHNYSGAPTDLKIKAVSPFSKSGNEQEIIVTPYNLVFNEISEKGMTYLKLNGSFEVETKSFGKLKFVPLTCQQSIDLTQFMVKQQREGKPIEKFFMDAAGFFAHKEELRTEGQFDPQKVYQNYLSVTSDMKLSSVLTKALEHIFPDLSFEINAICEETKKPFRAPITSLAGVKDIFLISDSESELL